MAAFSFWFYTANLLVTAIYVTAILRRLGRLDPDHPQAAALARWLLAVLGWAFFDLVVTQATRVLGPAAGFWTRNALSFTFLTVAALSVDLVASTLGPLPPLGRRWHYLAFAAVYPLILLWPGSVHPDPLMNRLGFPVVPGWTHYLSTGLAVVLVGRRLIDLWRSARGEPDAPARREKLLMVGGGVLGVLAGAANSVLFLAWPWFPLLDSLAMLPIAVTVYLALTRYGRVLSPKSLYQAVTQALPQGLMHLRRGEITWANPALAGLLGLAGAEALRGRRLDELAGAQGPWSGSELGPWRVEAGLAGAGGRMTPCLLSAAPLEPGRPAAGLVVAVTDLSQRQRMEQELRDSESKYRAIYDNLMDVHFLLDLDGRVLAVSPSVAELLGFQPREITAMEPGRSAYFAPEDERLTLARIKSAGSLQGFEAPMRRKDGAQIWVSLNAKLVRDAAGAPLAIECLARDVTRRKRALEELEAARTRLEHLLKAVRVTIYTAEPRTDFPISYISPNLEAILGYRAEQVVGDQGFWTRMVHAGDIARARSQAAQVFDHGVAAMEYRFRHADGSWRWLRDEMTLLRGPAGEPLEVVGCFWDISQRKRGEEGLRQLAAGVAHNFNNVLMAIASHAQAAQELLAESAGRAADLAQLLEAMVRAASTGGDVVRRLNRYVGGWGRAEQSWRLLDLAELVASAVGLARAAWSSLEPERVAVELDLHPGLLVAGVRGELVEVFMNLAKNALEAMDRGGRLVVKSWGADGQAWLSVSDTGQGMSQEVQDRLFLPFFSTKGTSGQGMGLASSRGIITAHGGTIEVHSVLGQGTTFRLSLPQAMPAAAAAPVLAGELPRDLRILLVEDEALVALGLTRVLEGMGHRVEHAPGLRQARGMLAAGGLDLVICDLGLTDGSGWDLVADLAADGPGAPPVIVLTGWAQGQEPVARPHDLLPPRWVLYKPVLRQELLVVVAEAAAARTGPAPPRAREGAAGISARGSG